MQTGIRKLDTEDFKLVQNMQTSVADDYIPQAFHNLIIEPNILYGLFVDGQLVSIAGYSVFAEELAMLGRLRSDVRFHGHGFATDIMAYIRDAAFENPRIRWVGANTQEENRPTNRVLDKIGLLQNISTYSAIAADVTSFEKQGKTWNKIDDLKRKRYWLDKVYATETTFFPYECYYLLPSIPKLFTDDTIRNWTFYENPAQTRMIIMKHDEKKQTYLHVIYPWDDITEQPGLWETITKAQQQLEKRLKTDVFIWMDLSKQTVNKLPDNHPFDLPSPWTLYAAYREACHE